MNFFAYRPDSAKDHDESLEMGKEFEAFKPDEKYHYRAKKLTPDMWPIIVPHTAPMIGQLPEMISKKMRKEIWKFAEPTNAQRNNPGRAFIGTSGTRQATAPNFAVGANARFHHNIHFRPEMSVKMGNNDSYATDWEKFKEIKRTNAVTFRGDSRPPLKVIKEMGGFTPPNSRTDRDYLENSLYTNFTNYLQDRFGTGIPKNDFLRAVDAAAPTDADKKILSDFILWRNKLATEAAHLGRMTANPIEKAYISTARSIDTAIRFATTEDGDKWKRAGWLYVTVVHGGFVVPYGKDDVWQTEEGEIAQLGSIPSERIVGFCRIPGPNEPEALKPAGPFFFRRSFRKGEPGAFERIFKLLSGRNP